jgi:hypothetical protein
MRLAKCNFAEISAGKNSRGCRRYVSRFTSLQQYKLTYLRFLLARLYIDSLSDNTIAKEVKATLTILSKGAAALDDAYSKALERIKG